MTIRHFFLELIKVKILYKKNQALLKYTILVISLYVDKCFIFHDFYENKKH